MYCAHMSYPREDVAAGTGARRARRRPHRPSRRIHSRMARTTIDLSCSVDNVCRNDGSSSGRSSAGKWRSTRISVRTLPASGTDGGWAPSLRDGASTGRGRPARPPLEPRSDALATVAARRRPDERPLEHPCRAADAGRRRARRAPTSRFRMLRAGMLEHKKATESVSRTHVQ